ncbi:hypothetical protein SAMN05192529_11244 [Arachidicoccus rhizosphaerae]|uniref:Uncharacterized protein n=1 Tax=Arachidicoccus rhizosphaerae TaxID=551991 RepID=A0A1H3ZVL7_9BACT|nr:hypothetical protein [Arachidicoccus rhizosphaerae]SEA27324.1 hypothetical protein SAMN05192529_11244 [Arachidicoccus rhizosphaerae]
MEQIININKHPYWENHPDQMQALEARVNEHIAAGNIYEDGEQAEFNLLGHPVTLLIHVQTEESRVSGDIYNILDLELINHG